MTVRASQGRFNNFWNYVRTLSRARSSAGGVKRYALESLEGRTLFAVLTIAQENELPGTPQSQWDVARPGDPTLEGFATDMSVNQGETISFKINDTGLTPYRIDIYRMGYYQGMGARLVGSIADSQTLETVQPAPLFEPSTGLIDAGNWSVSASWQVPENATSGIYFARLVRLDNGGGSQIVFVVRDDDGGSDLLFQTSDATWQSYNTWGGQSLYTGASDFGGRAVKVSYNRPFNTRYTAPLGRDFVFGPEFAMVRWLEANGYDVSYFTNIDLDRRGEELKEHKAFLSVGHDEYWSGGMRAAAESARDSGVHLGFFSGNEVYWKMRWENAISADGTPYRTMVTYKETRNNAKIDPSPEWTGTWRDPRFSPPSDGGRPENGLIGQIFTVNRGPGGESGTPFEVPAEYSNLRFWRNTSVANLAQGQVATLGDIVLGYEWDEDLDNGFRPAGLIRMSRTTQTVPQKLLDYGSTVGVGEATHTLTLYRAPSGAIVFGAGTVQWSYGLDGTHDGLQTRPDPAMRQATVNLFADMGVQPSTLQPGLLRASMSVDIAPPTSVIAGPAPSSAVMVGSAVTITGTASDTGGGIVGGVEVSTDDGVTWRRANGRETWSFAWVPSAIGPTTILSRAADDSGNIQVAYGAVPVTVAPQPTSSTGLVGAWSFNAGSGAIAVDASGLGLNGSISGATWTSGVYGGGLLFNGVDSWVTVNDSNALDLTNGMTLEAWVKPSAAGTWRNVLMKERSGALSYALYSSNDHGTPEATANITFDRPVFATNPIALNSWAHLAVTYDGSVMTFFVNGTPVGTSNQAGNITTGTGALRFGGNSTWGEFFEGVIDEVRIYNRALTEGEIRVDASTPIGGTLETTPPSGSVTAPASGSSVSGDTTLTADATDNGGVAKVEFIRNGVRLGSDTTAPHTFVWRTAQFANGAHTITARIFDYAGNVFTTAPITLNVNNPAERSAPVVNIKHPTGGARVSGTIPLWATASDNIGVAGVRFQVDGVAVGAEDVTAAYQLLLDTRTLSDGEHTVTAIARDAAGNESTSASVVITVGNAAPVLVAHTPASGGTVPATTDLRMTFNVAIDPTTVELELRRSNGQFVTGVVTYDAATRTATFTPSISLSIAATYTATLKNARDSFGNTIASPVTWSFTTSSIVANATIWQPSTTPAIPADSDTGAIELGLRFQAEVGGYITGVRFYKGAGNTGTHVGRLYTSGGQLLGSVTFTDETATGWQQASFDTPIEITGNTTYVVTYHAPVGRYAASRGYFTSTGYDGGVLEALPNAAGSANGLYRYGGGGVLPASSFNATNYWVDAVFSNTLVDTKAPTVVTRSPASSAIDVNVNSNATATFSEDVVPDTVSVVVRDVNGNVVSTSISYDLATRTVTVNPSAALAYNSTYTVTVTGAADAAGNVMTSTAWSFTTDVSPDLTPPTIASRSPASDATNVLLGSTLSVTFNEGIDPSTLVFELRNASGQVVAATVSYDAATRTATLDPSANFAYSSSYSATVRAADASGNLMTSPVTWSFTTEAPLVGATIWPATTTPAVTAATDTKAVELGVKFRSSVNGYITGVRFYKGPGNTGTHEGRLWSSTGTLLATITFADETETGWQQADFDTPVAVGAGQTYIASYYAPVGRYATNSGYFTTSGATGGPLTALQNGVDGRNGVYRYGAGGGFPSSGSANASNYWVDVAFSNTPPVDETPPSIVYRSPGPGATDALEGANVKVRFSEKVTEGTISLVLRDAAGNTVDSVVTYDAASRTATLNPAGPLVRNATYTATLEGAADAAGNVMLSQTWSFTIAPPLIGASIWPASATPAVVSATDNKAVEIGVKFRAGADGYITGIRFFKGGANTGTHVGRLWTSGGTLLATVTFTSESASGWQQANFDAPVAIGADRTYIASYYAPVGRYSSSPGYFATSGATSGPLTALASGVDGGNGVYRYGAGGGFPNATYNSINYWVDVVYASTADDLTAPVVTDHTPASGATFVAANSNPTVTFNEAVQAQTIALVLRDAANNPVPADVTYNAATRTATLDPTDGLVPGATYSVMLSGTQDVAGNTMAPLSWSFTVAPPIVGATLWSDAVTPATASESDTQAVEVGVTFQSSVDGYITGVRFYKGALNTGTHVGRLWSSAGALLASVTFTEETATGWQTATFSTPVAITAGQTYVASYFAPVGGYAANPGYLSTGGYTNGPLTALSSVFRYGPGGVFPTSSGNGTNYWVDVLFSSIL